MKLVSALFVLLVLPVADTPQHDIVDPCPVDLPAWVELEDLPDSLQVPPDFFMDQPTVPVENLIICQHGIFFNFHAPQQGTSTEYYISFPVPTYDEYQQYVLADRLASTLPLLDPESIRHEAETRVAAYTQAYNQLRLQIRQVLGERYVEDRRIDLASAPAQLRLEFPLVFVWDAQEMPFETYPGIYWHR